VNAASVGQQKPHAELIVAYALDVVINHATGLAENYCKKKTYQFKHNVKDDQIIRQKLQISKMLKLEKVLHVTWNSAFIDAE
jgi:hypothetical protein